MIVPASAMVLAAGFGTRMGELTRTCPKPLLCINGRPMIDLALDLVADAGAEVAVVNLHYLGDQIREHLEGRVVPEVLFSEEQPEILDTGGGVVKALPLLRGGPFFTLNSDAIFAGPNPLSHLSGAWRPEDMDALLLLVARSRTHAYSRAGDFFLSTEGTAPVRRGDSKTAPLVYSGTQIIAPSALNDAPEGPFSMNLIWDRLLTEGRLAAVVYPGDWVDVGTAEGLAAADQVLAGMNT
jgi:MurNAc alpha-1-phosphate uridylyltransferase